MHRYLQIILLVSFTMLIQGCSDKTDNESNNSSSSSISSVNDADNNSSLSTSSSANSTPANSSSSTQQVVTSSSSSSVLTVVASSSSSTTSSSSSVIVVHSSSSSVTSSSSSTTSSSSLFSTETNSSSSSSSAPIVINGYTLPPQPDETLNNSTLLGIDSNNNGVRDDVEIYVLNKYKDHHKIVSEIALQAGRAHQLAIGDASKAKETTVYMSAALYCNWYFEDDADSYGDPILIDHTITNKQFKDIQINTKERIKAYLQYNRNLSGGVYRQAYGLKAKALCDFNVTKLLED